MSTQFGVAWEYLPKSPPAIDVIVAGRRIEGLFLETPQRFDREFARHGRAVVLRGQTNATLTNVSFTNYPTPLGLEDPGTHATLIDCHFDALGWSKEVAGAEIFGDRSAASWSLENAISRAKDEVLIALAEASKADGRCISVAEYVNTKKEKSVLVLGDYSASGMDRLLSICACLTDLGYEPFLVKDIPDIFGTDLQQKVAILGGVARFVLIDDSSPSGHLTEFPIAQQGRWVTVLLHAGGERASFMTAGASATSSVIGERDFDPSAPRPGVEQAVAWAESRLPQLEAKYISVYPWRIRRPS